MDRKNSAGRRRTCRRFRRGFTLVETLIATGISAILVASVAQITVSGLRVGKVTGNKADLQRQARRGLDSLQQDLQASANVISTYNGVTSGPTALVLQAPSYDSSYQPLGSSDYILYRRVGTAPPYTLNRQVIVATGSARPASSDRVLAQGLSGVNFACLANTQASGNGTTLLFSLAGALQSTTLGGIEGTPRVTIAGNLVTSGVTFAAGSASSTATFATAPALGATVDILYPLDPSVTANQSAISAVAVTLSLATTDASIRTSPTQSIALSGGAALRNH